MKSRKSVVYLLLISAVVLSVGLAIAYYNTASLGYDNANIFTLDNDSIKLFDITVRFEDISNLFKKLKEFFDFDSIVI